MGGVGPSLEAPTRWKWALSITAAPGGMAPPTAWMLATLPLLELDDEELLLELDDEEDELLELEVEPEVLELEVEPEVLVLELDEPLLDDALLEEAEELALLEVELAVLAPPELLAVPVLLLAVLAAVLVLADADDALEDADAVEPEVELELLVPLVAGCLGSGNEVLHPTAARAITTRIVALSPAVPTTIHPPSDVPALLHLY